MRGTLEDALMDSPPDQIDCSALRLQRWRTANLAELVAASAASFDHLRPWMPWAQEMPSEDSTLPFLRGCEQQWAAGEAFQFAMRRPGDDAVVGSCGLMRRIGDGALEIGYWVHAAHTRRGLATAAAAALTWAGFALPDTHQLEIHVDVANLNSRAVAARLGYQQIGVRSNEFHSSDAGEAPGATGQDEIWRLTSAQWPLSRAAQIWHEQRGDSPEAPTP
jgi:RimJ/RimL family protein N-acetyltransferase